MPPSSGGVLIKRKHLLRQRQSIDLVNDARRQAGRLVKTAQGQADDIRQKAYREGYQEGLLTAAAAVADYLGQEQRLGTALQGQLNEHARQLLSAALNHPDMLLELLDEWLAALPERDTSDTLCVLLPAAARGSHARLQQKIQAVWPGKSRIEYHPENRFVMKYGDRLAEFDAGDFQTAAVRRLTAIPTLPEQCRQLTESAQRRLHELFLHHHVLNKPGQGDNER